jgi:hypothetical protein
MPGANVVVASTTQAQCPHAGRVNATGTNTRVRAAGQSVILVSDTFTVAGCPFQIPTPGGPKPQPCVTGSWLQPATKVFVGGQPVIVQTSSGLCRSTEQIPQGPPSVTQTQGRVTAT